MSSPFGSDDVVVVGGGISGVACARRLHDAGLPVKILERSHRLGGRMAVRTEQVHGRAHAVDIGASYFTVKDERFAAVAHRWKALGLAGEWTDTFFLASPDGRIGTTTSPQRWSATRGLRSLVEDLAEGLDVAIRHEVSSVRVDEDGRARVDDQPVAAVVLAMPDPQAADLLDPRLAGRLDISGHAWAPVLCVWATWRDRWWQPFDGIYVDGSEVLAWVADDGRRRGDDAPVLVAHSTNRFAERRLDDIASGVEPVLAALPGVLGSGSMPEPEWVRVHRWSISSPRHPRPRSTFGLAEGPIGVCGDGWGERSRVEQAWLSGHELGGELLTRLGAAEPPAHADR